MRVKLACFALYESNLLALVIRGKLDLGEMVLLLILGRKSKARFLLTDAAERLSVLVLATLETKFKVKAKLVLLVWIKIDFVGNIFSAEKLFCSTSSALETVTTLPAAVWQLH